MNIERVVRRFIERDKNGLFICPYCSEPFKCLAYHTRQVHNIKARALREAYGLPYNYPLSTPDVLENRRDKALLYDMDKQLLEKGKNTRFKKNRKLGVELIEKIRRGHTKSIRRI